MYHECIDLCPDQLHDPVHLPNVEVSVGLAIAIYAVT